MRAPTLAAIAAALVVAAFALADTSRQRIFGGPGVTAASISSLSGWSADGGATSTALRVEIGSQPLTTDAGTFYSTVPDAVTNATTSGAFTFKQLVALTSGDIAYGFQKDDAEQLMVLQTSRVARIASGGSYGFSSSATNAAASDTVLTRTATGVGSNFGFSTGSGAFTGFASNSASGSCAFAKLTGARTCLITGSADYESCDGTTCSWVGTALATDSTVTATNGFIQTISDQSADCDNAATANTPSGKVCIQAGQATMTLTNSLITSASIIMLTMATDDDTCRSAAAVAGSGSATISCAGNAITATANTVVNFVVFR